MKKPDLDQFFTPKEKAQQLIKKVESLYDLSQYDNIIEPSAGSGSFYNQLPSNKVGYDLEPRDSGIIKQDFLKVNLTGKNIVIGNPPYGKRGSMALKFINHCAKFSEVIAFILPRGFMRTAMQNSVDENFHLVHEEMLDTFEFPDGTEYKVKSVFQIWEKRKEKRKRIEEPKTHKDFELLHKHLSWITDKELKAIQEEYAYGIGQNKMRIQDSKEFKKGSVWFVKPKVPGVKERFEKSKFETAYYTTGAPSLSKGDIISGYIASAESKN